MTDTAQPLAAESDGIAEAANAFKVSLGQAEASRQRDERGRFASTQEEAEAHEAAEEIEVEDGAEQAPDAAESDVETDDTDEAAEEAQHDDVDMPASWSKEDAELWNTLPPEARARIAEREGQRDAAVNHKFQEAANLRKANEAVINEANANRDRFAQAADVVLSLVQPQKPPVSMLNPQSQDYNPDGYHLAIAQYEQAEQILSDVRQQREEALAQQERDAEAAEKAAYEDIEAKARPELLKLVPEITNPEKAGEVINRIASYAISVGIPEHVFTDPSTAKRVTSAELLIAEKARRYDEMVAAQGRVKPKGPKPATPPVRPGVTTPRSAIEHTKRKQNYDRLARSGSVADGAAVFKDLFKGK